MTHFVYMSTQKSFVRSGKVEMISTFQRNRNLRKVSVNKTFMYVQEQKKKRCRRKMPFGKFYPFNILTFREGV